MEFDCSKCGSTVHKSSNFCPTCGSSFEKKPHGILFWIALLIGCGVIVVGLISAALNDSSPPPTSSSVAAKPVPVEDSPPVNKPELGTEVSWPVEPQLSPPWRLRIGMPMMEVLRIMGKASSVTKEDTWHEEWAYPGEDPPTTVYFSYVEVSRIERKGALPRGLQPTGAQLLGRQLRKQYAAHLDSKLLDAHIESVTKTSGSGDTNLVIKDALAGRVRAREIARAIDFEVLDKMGFKKLIYTNGFGDELGRTFTWNIP